jgi:hypothetical protein
VGIEIRIEAASAADLHAQMAALLAGAAPNFGFDGRCREYGDSDADVLNRGLEQAREHGIIAPADPEPGEDKRAPKPRGRKPKDEPQAPEEPKADDTPPADEPEITYADVQKAVTQLAAARGRDAVVGVFKQFGVDHGTKLKSEQWGAAIAELTAAREA